MRTRSPISASPCPSDRHDKRRTAASEGGPPDPPSLYAVHTFEILSRRLRLPFGQAVFCHIACCRRGFLSRKIATALRREEYAIVNASTFRSTRKSYKAPLNCKIPTSPRIGRYSPSERNRFDYGITKYSETMRTVLRRLQMPANFRSGLFFGQSPLEITIFL